jgi:hypothetical protein
MLKMLNNLLHQLLIIRDVDALSKLVGASAAAIESLNKILLQDKANEAKIQVKEMDIQSKKELQDKSNESVRSNY